jgi:hypothetical protein
MTEFVDGDVNTGAFERLCQAADAAGAVVRIFRNESGLAVTVGLRTDEGARAAGYWFPDVTELPRHARWLHAWVLGGLPGGE